MTNSKQSSNKTIIQRFAKIFQNKPMDGDNISDVIDDNDLQQIAGHVTRGSQEGHFEYLQKVSTAQKFAWIMGGDGLALFLKRSNLEALRSIGFDDQWIRKKLEDQEYFRLGVFPRFDTCVPGTWDGILSLVESHYPKTISSKIQRQVEGLKTLTFDEIEARARLSYLAGASYFDVHEMAINGHSNDPRFMSEERFMQCEGTLEESRGFLYTRLGLSRLFDGSGFTKDMAGRLFVREYLRPNMSVRDIPGFRYFDLPIDDTDLMPDA